MQEQAALTSADMVMMMNVFNNCRNQPLKCSCLSVTDWARPFKLNALPRKWTKIKTLKAFVQEVTLISGTNEHTEVKMREVSNSDERIDASAGTKQYFYSFAVNGSSCLTKVPLFIIEVFYYNKEKSKCYLVANFHCCSLWRVWSRIWLSLCSLNNVTPCLHCKLCLFWAAGSHTHFAF